jgi:hypothetical protein
MKITWNPQQSKHLPPSCSGNKTEWFVARKPNLNALDQIRDILEQVRERGVLSKKNLQSNLK